MLFTPDQEQRAAAYASSLGLVLAQEVGAGTDGAVWKTASKRQSVVKAFERDRQYRAELACYHRLTEHKVRQIGRFSVPRLIGWSDKLLVIEITLVTPPYVIDFGKAYVDSAPEHSEQTWIDHEAEQMELWGEKYGEVQAVLWKLESLGIYYRDATPRNIAFPPEEDSDGTAAS